MEVHYIQEISFFLGVWIPVFSKQKNKLMFLMIHENNKHDFGIDVFSSLASLFSPV